MMTFLPSKSRHRVLAILFTASIISFVDRTAMTVALPFIKVEFGLSAVESGMVVSAFFAAYAIMQVPGGMLADRFGVRRVATAALVWWSAFTAFTGLVGHYFQMLAVRFLFGLGEGVYPACTFKTIATWFPQRQRGTANAIMLSASRLGQAIAPLIVVWVITSLGGWRHVFLALTIPGLVIAALFWFGVPDSPERSARISDEERRELAEGVSAENQSAGTTQSVWGILMDPVILRYVLIYFVFDFAFWGFVSWSPTYLIEVRHFTPVQMGVTASLPFVAGFVGCIAGGWISDRFFKDNRRVPIIIFPAVSALFLYLTYVSTSVAMVMFCQTVLGFALNYFFASFWALPVSTIPTSRMGVTSGTINLGGQIAGTLAPVTVGFIVTASGGHYGATFAVLIGSLIAVTALALSLPKKSVARHSPASIEPE